MKLTKLTLMAAVATAAGFCMSVNAATGGKTGNLVLDLPVTNVNVTAGASTVGGSWNTTPDIEGSYFVIDNDAASSNQFTATARTTNKVVTCNFRMVAAPVPDSAFPNSGVDSGAQVAFCIYTNSVAEFKAYVNDGWKPLSGATIPATDTEYTLTITFDYSDSTKYAKFAVNGTDLEDSEHVKWFQTAASTTGVRDYCFVGTGNLKSFITEGQNIEASVNPPDPEDGSVVADITPPGGSTTANVTIPAEALEAVSGGTTAAKVEALMETASNGETKLNNFILFGTDSSGNIKEIEKPISKVSTTVTDGAIPLDFSGSLNVQTVTGTTVKYELQGRKTWNGTWDTIGEYDDAKIPTSALTSGYKYFKVRVKVNY